MSAEKVSNKFSAQPSPGTAQLLGKQIDALARRFAVSQDARVGEEIERLATEYETLGKPWVFVGRQGSRPTSAQ